MANTRLQTYTEHTLYTHTVHTEHTLYTHTQSTHYTHILHEEIFQVWYKVLARNEGMFPGGEDREATDRLTYQNKITKDTVISMEHTYIHI